MAERRPPGFNVDLGFYDSEEVLSIPRKIRAAAVGVWTLCGSYSANKLTDGYVSAEALRDRGCTPAIRAALMATKPEPLWSDAHAGGIQFTRWPKWQRTSAEVKAYREADAERKRKAREAKRNSPTSNNVEMSGRTNDGPSQTVRSDSGTPKTETETETETSKRERAARGMRLPEGWQPTTELVAQMRSEHPHVDLRAEHVKFTDYWRSIPGAKGRKADWSATWRNWIRRAAENQPRHNGNNGANGHRVAASDAAFAAAQALKDFPAIRLELE